MSFFKETKTMYFVLLCDAVCNAKHRSDVHQLSNDNDNAMATEQERRRGVQRLRSLLQAAQCKQVYLTRTASLFHCRETVAS